MLQNLITTFIKETNICQYIMLNIKFFFLKKMILLRIYYVICVTKIVVSTFLQKITTKIFCIIFVNIWLIIKHLVVFHEQNILFWLLLV